MVDKSGQEGIEVVWTCGVYEGEQLTEEATSQVEVGRDRSRLCTKVAGQSQKYVQCEVTGAERCEGGVHGQRGVEGASEQYKWRCECMRYDRTCF